MRDHSALFRAKGCEVVEYRRSSEELRGVYGQIRGFASGIANPFSVRRFAEFLDRERPAVVHIHNLNPLITPAILPEAKKRGIPVVMTVHNFRIFCPNGLFAVNNAICEDCAQQGSVWPCIKKNCLYSRLKTLGYAVRSWKNVHYLLEGVDRYLCLTPFQQRKLCEYGLPAEKCRQVPNFIDAEWLAQARQLLPGNGDYVAYMGRLSEEKGIDIILEAARRLPDIPFKLAGNGAEGFRQAAPANVEFVGYLTGKRQFEFLRHARLHLMASRCYENFPTSLLQGMSLGIPELVPAHGGMPDIIRGAGETFAPGALPETLGGLYHDSTRLQQYRQGALAQIEHYTSEAFWQQISGIYQEICGCFRS